ncbi:MAG TPA: FecR domain-containing protein [Pedobacter sp.]|nr:FecR domain-containing protein [Pedobacter sp.]
MEDQSYRLIVEYFDKTIDDRGLTQLQEWIEAHAENLEQFIETIRILEAAKEYTKLPDQQENTRQRIKAQVSKAGQDEKTNTRKLRRMLYAAACTLIGISSLLWYNNNFSGRRASKEFAEISNPDGQHSKIVLPDSSVVYLSGGSRIKYAKNFMASNRSVYLNGEAFFDVVHQAKRPFIVISGEISTVVLGTSFNVKAFDLESKVVVTVKTGKVGVMSAVKGLQQLVRYLTPDEQIEIDTQSGLYTFNAADADAVTGWINNDFIFYDTPIREIAASLEHRYGVKIEFTDQELGKTRLTAKFKNVPINQVMENLSLLSGLAFTQKGNHIFITNHHQKGGKIMK